MKALQENAAHTRHAHPTTDDDIINGLQNVRVMVRALAQTMEDEERFQMAQSFGCALVNSWWQASNQLAQTSMGLRRPAKALSAHALTEAMTGVAQSTGELAARLEPEIAAYQIGLTYTYVLPAAYRATHGIYYTPPVLTERLINLATKTGVDWKSCRVLDPACGGGAFLAPIAKHIIEQMPECSPRILLENISNRLRGYEIDPFGAWLAQVALDVVLLPFAAVSGKLPPNVVTLCDSLYKNPPRERFDLVIGNPPYARTKLTPELREKFKRSLYGHANLYGVFTDIALRHTRIGGVIAYVTPTSFLAGGYFKNLRALLGQEAPPKQLDFVAARKKVFDDVLQETLLATYERGADSAPVAVQELRIRNAQKLDIQELGTLKLPADPSLPWVLPRNIEQVTTVQALQRCKHHLIDWGYTVSTGPLVWNRFKDQLHPRRAKGRLPLIWAESVLASGKFEWRAQKRNHEPWFEVREKDGWLTSDQPCVLLQRTTAKEQHRRLIAAALPASFIKEHGAVVIENHLNMLRPLSDAPRVSPEVLAAFLNSRAADQAFRCVSGSVAVSAYELEALPLPSPRDLEHLQRLLFNKATRLEIEDECQRLYQG